MGPDSVMTPREMPRKDRPPRPASVARSRTQAQAQRSEAWGGHGALSCNWRRCCFAAVSDDRPGVGSNSSRCALLRMNRCVKACDVLALLLLQSVLLPCPTHQMVRPGAILHRDRRSTTQFRPSWPPGRGERRLHGRMLRALIAFLYVHIPGFVFVRTPAQSVAAETQ